MAQFHHERFSRRLAAAIGSVWRNFHPNRLFSISLFDFQGAKNRLSGTAGRNLFVVVTSPREIPCLRPRNDIVDH